jgi:hypothetical protein
VPAVGNLRCIGQRFGCGKPVRPTTVARHHCDLRLLRQPILCSSWLTIRQGAIKRLLGMVEKGLMEVDDSALAERLRNLKTKRAELQCNIDGGSANISAQRNVLNEAKVVRTAEAVRGALQDASPERRKAYLKLFVAGFGSHARPAG